MRCSTERNMDLSVIVFIKLAASGDKLGLDGATTQFFCLHQQTRGVLLEVLQVASFVHENRPVLLHQPAI
jgi:hypothetical protein